MNFKYIYIYIYYIYIIYISYIYIFKYIHIYAYVYATFWQKPAIIDFKNLLNTTVLEERLNKTDIEKVGLMPILSNVPMYT